MDGPAPHTYTKNFPGAIYEKARVDLFVNPDIYEQPDFQVDILYVLFPCPSFSAMQTRKPEDYEIKQASILAVGDLIRMARPRIFTMEEVFGLLFDENIGFFKVLVKSLNKHGFSVGETGELHALWNAARKTSTDHYCCWGSMHFPSMQYNVLTLYSIDLVKPCPVFLAQRTPPTLILLRHSSPVFLATPPKSSYPCNGFLRDLITTYGSP